MPHISIMEIKRVFDILDKLKVYAPKKDILNAKENKQWVSYSLEDFINTANYVSTGLLQLGLSPGDNVALMAGNMPQWNFVDYGSQQVAMPTVPIFPTLSNDDLKYILNHCEAKVIFISDKAVYNKILKLKDELLFLKHIYSFNKVEGVQGFSEFLELGKQNYNTEKINTIKHSIRGEDILTLLYTSGTTGTPKGVMLSHNNLLNNVFICQNIVAFSNQWRALSFLPLNHVYERFLNTLYLFHGVSIYYAESFETIGENCREIHPHLFVAVPRVLERVLERISNAGEKLGGFKKRIFDWSMNIAERYELKGANGAWYEMQRKICDKLVYKKWREAIGGNIVAVVSGGAALNPRLERIFTCAGIVLLQGYGLTETCVVVAVNRFEEERRMFGTVGLVVENSQVELAAEDGEILMKGPSLMMGYYKNPEATAEVIDKDGWFHTGDIGTFVNGKFLKITDRKKEIFKSSSGKYISPVAIENKLKECKYIEQCMVIGEGQKFASALIIPSLSYFKEYCSARSIEWKGNDDMFEHEELRKIIGEHVKKVNASLAAYEQLKRYQFINAVWTVETGEITPKLSLKRKKIAEKNKDVIAKIFGVED
ncbi:MAG: long-chain fatty acid--CoA ligase [Bacteroidia bacterium]|nr:long-chain fatty acid--CoA ligase [Bacteroidia bacterium]